jgi:DNA mismatch repair protein MutS
MPAAFSSYAPRLSRQAQGPIIGAVQDETPEQLDTPAMRQYKAFKEQYPDYILLFRMGDFYEMFYEDARIASKTLGLALTARSKGPTAVPLAGIPYHALDGYLARLIRAGHRAAICEQVEDPKLAKGVVKRDVVRLITPGTLTEPELLEQKQSNYLAAVFVGASAGIAWVELSSGMFQSMVAPADAMMDELVRLGPAEVIVAEGGALDTPAWRSAVRQSCGSAATNRPPLDFEQHAAKQALLRHFRAATLEGFGFAAWDEGLSAAGAVIEYLRQTQRTALAHIRSLRRFDRSDHVAIDATTLRGLEVHRTLRTNQRAGSLLACMDRTCTGMGARLLERWLTFPLTKYSDIVARQDAVEELASAPPRLEKLRSLLVEVSQVDRVAAAIMMNRLRPRDLVALGGTLALLPKIAAAMEGLLADLLLRVLPGLEGLEAPAELIARAIDPACPGALREGGVIAPGYSEDLDRLRRMGADGEQWLSAYQAAESRRTGIANLKVGYNKVFGYYIEINHAAADRAPANYVRKQTIKNAERYITDELKRYEEEALTAGERARSLEAELFERLRLALCEHVEAFQRSADALAELDVLACLAQTALERGYRRPTITQDSVLNIVGGRHPVLAEQLRDQFVPNDVQMEEKDGRLLIITGPNMAGKSTYIRQAALLTLLAQTGSFLPCESATIGLVDRIYARVGAADELARGLSTFMLEMVETANILNTATRRSLVILDEVGRGTSTTDGLALAWAICEHLALRVRCRTLFATHYHELTQLEEVLDGAKNLNVAVREWGDEVIFLHKMVEGGTDRSYGLHVARLAGVPGDVVQRAQAILPQVQAHLAESLGRPDLAQRARAAAAQMQLFADPAARIARELLAADPDNLTPAQALELVRKWKAEL